MTPADSAGGHRPSVAVVGAGTMGGAMAGRLLAGGLTVTVWHRHPASVVALAQRGARVVERLGDAVGDADIVLTMLPTAQAVAEVMLDQGGLEAMKAGAVWLQMATIGVEATGRLVEETARRRPDVAFVDAPVSGSRGPAESGRLEILASGPDGSHRVLDPVLKTLGRTTLWLGPAGAGSRMKLVLNTWLAFQAEGAAEAAAIADRLGLDRGSLSAALDGNPLASGYAMAKLARMQDEDYHADFAIEWALKDLDLVVAEAGQDVAPVAAAIGRRWRDLVSQGAGGLDVSAARLGLGTPVAVEPGAPE